MAEAYYVSFLLYSVYWGRIFSEVICDSCCDRLSKTEE